jgi:hypothetical protein
MVVSDEPLTAGATVPVELKSGSRKPVKLGRLVGYIYAIDNGNGGKPRFEGDDGRFDPAFERASDFN